MINDLRAIAIFAEMVRQKSFRGAGKVLNLSPSVVSYHVTQLEKRLGTALIYRSTRKLSLTYEGEVLYRHAQDMLSSAQQGLSEVSLDTREPEGRITLSVPAALARSRINQDIAEFCRCYPKIELRISYTDERQNLIGNGIDLAIRVGNLADSALKVKSLGHIERKLVCSPEFYERYEAPEHPQQLTSWP